MVYDVVATDVYGFTIPEDCESEIHMRRIEKMIDSLLTLDGQTLLVGRTSLWRRSRRQPDAGQGAYFIAGRLDFMKLQSLVDCRL